MARPHTADRIAAASAGFRQRVGLGGDSRAAKFLDRAAALRPRQSGQFRDHVAQLGRRQSHATAVMWLNVA